MCGSLRTRRTTSAQNHPGQVTASRNITAPDGRHLAFSVSGKMPAGATVSATSVQRTAPQGKQLKGAYDITVKNGNAKWQPQAGQPAMVSITDPSFTDGQMLDVWHEGAGGLEFVATVSPVSGKITFPARSFSVYIVTETGGNARLAVTFVQADGQTTIMVKRNDIDLNDPNDTLFNKIVYDVGAGEYNQDLIFRGWYKAGKDYTYTIADAANALTIEGVREEVKNVLNSSVTEGDTIYFYALIYKSFTVTYVDTNNAVLSAENYLRDTTVTEIDYTVLQNFTLDDHHSLLG
ncbi:MAG: hypothetical protein K5882_03275 [Bacteroidales bacterium]|nr:hypothetical protein [Bacteroidales bacterium]